MSLQLLLKEAANRYIYDMKLDPKLMELTEVQYGKLYDLWRKYNPHTSRVAKPLPSGVHGYISTCETGTLRDAGINSLDPISRQRLAIVHEGIHAAFGPVANQPVHRDLHVLAGGLAHSIFPNTKKTGTPMFDADDLRILQSLKGDVDALLDDDYLDEDMMDDQGVVLADEEQFFRRGRRRKRASAGKNFAVNNLPPSLKVDDAASAKILSQYRGWATPYLIKMYETGQVIIPLRGITRVNNYSEWSGWTHGSLDDYWRAITSAMDSTSLSKTAKVDSSQYVPPTADAGTPVTVTAGSPTFPYQRLAGSVRAVGMIVRIALPSDNAGQLFQGTQAAATTQGESTRAMPAPAVVNFSVFNENTNRRRAFALTTDHSDRSRVLEFMVLLTENDRGSATVVGQDLNGNTPFSFVSGVNIISNARTAAVALSGISTDDYNSGLASAVVPSTYASLGFTELFNQLGGSVVTLETLNLRDIQGDSARR